VTAVFECGTCRHLKHILIADVTVRVPIEEWGKVRLQADIAKSRESIGVFRQL
jgi:hypothetical protein